MVTGIKRTRLSREIEKTFWRWFREKGHQQHYDIMGKGNENWVALEFGLYCYDLGLNEKKKKWTQTQKNN